MAMTYEKMRAALEEVSNGDDANAKAAKAALAALDAAGGGAAPGDGGDDKPAEDDDAPSTGGDTPPAADPPAEDDDKKAAAAAYREAIAARAEVAQVRAELKRERETAERATLIASRAFDAATIKLLQKAPIELVREAVKDAPESPVNPELERKPLQGSGQTQSTSDPKAKAELDARMGIAPAAHEEQSTPTRLVLSARGRKPAPPAPGAAN